MTDENEVGEDSGLARIGGEGGGRDLEEIPESIISQLGLIRP